MNPTGSVRFDPFYLLIGTLKTHYHIHSLGVRPWLSLKLAESPESSRRLGPELHLQARDLFQHLPDMAVAQK